MKKPLQKSPLTQFFQFYGPSIICSGGFSGGFFEKFIQFSNIKNLHYKVFSLQCKLITFNRHPPYLMHNFLRIATIISHHIGDWRNRFSIFCGVINHCKLLNVISRNMISPEVHYPKFNDANHATRDNLYK